MNVCIKSNVCFGIFKHFIKRCLGRRRIKLLTKIMERQIMGAAEPEIIDVNELMQRPMFDFINDCRTKLHPDKFGQPRKENATRFFKRKPSFIAVDQ